MAVRYVRFDMNELAKIAAKSIGHRHAPLQCINVEKFPDGLFNKTFLFTMDDGSQVVGKVPNRNAGLPHYTTASEVATMDFARNILKTPVPRVLAWSSNARKNPVGAEYIMEKVQGIPLETIWSKLPVERQLEVVKGIAEYQKRWMSVSLSQCGNLYYSADLNGAPGTRIYTSPSEPEVPDSRFTIGPSTGRDFVDYGRDSLDFDRGPWDTVEDYKRAIGHREIYCIRNMRELPKSPITLCGPGTYIPSREKKVAAVNDYLAILHYLLPTDPSISSPYLWHSDLHADSIFVREDDPTEITGIIDWQSAEILPLFDHARQPYFLDYDGPKVTSLGPPEFPQSDEFDRLSPAEKSKAQALYFKMSLSALYRTLTHGTNEILYKAMEFRETTGFRMMVLAQNLLVDGEALYRSRIVDLQTNWGDLPGAVQAQQNGTPPFPLRLSGGDIESISEDVAGTVRGMQLMEQVKEKVGANWSDQAIVQHGQYLETKCALSEAKSDIIKQFATCSEDEAIWKKSWPFDD